MIAMLKGTIDSIVGRAVTLDVAGVGYLVMCTSHCLKDAQVGQSVKLVVHTDVREDSIRLYGFEDQLEKQVFLLLTMVKGVGAKSASELVSRVEKRELLKIIAAGDITRLLQIKGVGKKTAERIIVELKDKVAEYALEGPTIAGSIEQGDQPAAMELAIEGLRSLGFDRRESEQAVRLADVNLSGSGPDAAALIRESLKFF
jgi:Holliday junction DNA helicase RuvA